LSECEARFGNWGLLNPLRDGVCTVLGTPTVVPTPPTGITSKDREEFHRMGDVNRDRVIDETDLNLIKAAYGSRPGDPNWNPDCDLNGDGKVDTKDTYVCSRNQGLDIYKWKGITPVATPLGFAHLFRSDVLSENWREVVSSFSPVLIALGLAAAPGVVDWASRELRKAGVIS